MMSELIANGNLCDEVKQSVSQGKAKKTFIVSRKTLLTALERFFSGEIDERELIAWANILESHDEILYERGYEKLVADVVFCIASPEINGPLDALSVQRLMKLLTG